MIIKSIQVLQQRTQPATTWKLITKAALLAKGSPTQWYFLKHLFHYICLLVSIAIPMQRVYKYTVRKMTYLSET